MTHFRFMLAPLEDMTSNAFRTLCFNHGADLTFTEMVRFESLAKNNKSTWDRIILKDSTPTVIQLIGNKEIYLKKFLSTFKPEGNFQGFDFNIGCPAPNFVNNGMGCAMIKRVSKTRELVSIIKKQGFPVSLKLRLGMNLFEKQKKTYLNLIKSVDADFFIVHARHGKETYANPADFTVYEECTKLGKEIIANGDIKTKEHIEFLKSVGVNGAMIGRSAISDPAIFNRLKGLTCPSFNSLTEEYTKLSEKFEEEFRYKKNILKRIGKDAEYNVQL